jgi:hypothetical protein
MSTNSRIDFLRGRHVAFRLQGGLLTGLVSRQRGTNLPGPGARAKATTLVGAARRPASGEATGNSPGRTLHLPRRGSSSGVPAPSNRPDCWATSGGRATRRAGPSRRRPCPRRGVRLALVSQPAPAQARRTAVGGVRRRGRSPPVVRRNSAAHRLQPGQRAHRRPGGTPDRLGMAYPRGCVRRPLLSAGAPDLRRAHSGAGRSPCGVGAGLDQPPTRALPSPAPCACLARPSPSSRRAFPVDEFRGTRCPQVRLLNQRSGGEHINRSKRTIRTFWKLLIFGVAPVPPG